MANKPVNISVNDVVTNTTKAMAKVTSAIFEERPGTAPTIKGKKKSAQFTFKINTAKDKSSIESKLRRKVLGKLFKTDAVQIEIAIKEALESVIIGLVTNKNAGVRVMGRSLGSAKPTKPIEDEPFAKFIKTKAGAGEIGLPDPDESLRILTRALVAAIRVDVVVRENGPQVKFNFDQRRLLTLTPHPSKMEKGKPSQFFSWLSLVTGPDFVSGTPGYGLVRIGDLQKSLNSSKGAKSGGLRQQRRVNITEGLIRASRTRGNAGELAGLMMSNRTNNPRGMSPAEAFGGVDQDYTTNPRFKGFWDEWWIRTKLDLGVWTRRIMRTAVRKLLRG